MEFEDKSDKPKPICTHPDYLYTLKLIKIDKPELYLEQIVARVQVYCKHCNAPCTFKISSEFSINNASASNNDSIAILPVNLPPVLFEEEEDNGNQSKTIH